MEWGWAILAFAALHAAVAALQPWLFRIAAQDSQWTVAHVAADLGDARPDVVFMGSSRVATGFDPLLVEGEIAASTGRRIRAVNLAVTGATSDTNRLVLKNLIGTDRQPQVIVYGVWELEMLASAGEANVRQDLPYVSSIERLDDYVDYGEAPWRRRAWFLAEQWFPVERDRRLIRDALEIVSEDGSLRLLRAPLPGEQGFHRVSTAAANPDPDRPRREYARPLSRAQWSTIGPSRIERLIDLAHSRGIEIILVDAPVTSRHRSFWRSRERMERYLSVVREIAEGRQAPLLELYENPGDLVPDRGFTDTHHLNERGAAIVCHELVERLLAARFPGEPPALQ